MYYCVELNECVETKDLPKQICVTIAQAITI